MSLVNESPSPSVPQLGDGASSQLLRFRLQLDRAVANGLSVAKSAVTTSRDTAELAMPFQSGSANERNTAGTREGVTELINIPSDRVVPIPHLPPAVMGVYNWRGEILWMVDLAMLLGSHQRRSAATDRRFYPTIVVSGAPDRSGQTKTIGLVVDEIAEIEWCELAPSQPPPSDRSERQSPWVKGYAVSTTGENLTILDELALLDRADLHADI